MGVITPGLKARLSASSVICQWLLLPFLQPPCTIIDKPGQQKKLKRHSMKYRIQNVDVKIVAGKVLDHCKWML